MPAATAPTKLNAARRHFIGVCVDTTACRPLPDSAANRNAGQPLLPVLTAEGSTEGVLDPQSNRVQWRNSTLKVTEVPWNLGPTSREAALERARRDLGVNPQQLSWNAQITGDLDWRSGKTGATQGRLEVNCLCSGNWKVEARPFLDVAWDPRMVPRGRRPPQTFFVMIHPSEVEARDSDFIRSRRDGGQSVSHEPEDEVFTSGRTGVTRIGRWVGFWISPEALNNPSIHQAQYEQLRKFVTGPGRQLEQAMLGNDRSKAPE